MTATPPLVKMHKQVVPTEPFYWRTDSMRPGVLRCAASPIDAVVDYIKILTKCDSLTPILVELGISAACHNRCRHRKMHIPHTWLMRAAIYSATPYAEICRIAGEQPVFHPHHSLKKAQHAT